MVSYASPLKPIERTKGFLWFSIEIKQKTYEFLWFLIEIHQKTDGWLTIKNIYILKKNILGMRWAKLIGGDVFVPRIFFNLYI